MLSASTVSSREMSGKKVDYDEIAVTYNERYEAGGSFEGIASILKSIIQNSSAERILEVGCGTGHWLGELQRLERELFGLDLSPGMLGQATQGLKSTPLVCGNASCLPFIDACFDMIFCVNAIHHFDQKQKFISQAKRAIQSGGMLVIIGWDPHAGNDRNYIYHYFDGVHKNVLNRHTSFKTIEKWMIETGFERIQHRLADRIIKPLYGDEVLKSPFLKKHNSSQLILLSDEAYIAGLNRIKDDLHKAKRSKKILKFEVDISMWLITGLVD